MGLHCVHSQATMMVCKDHLVSEQFGIEGIHLAGYADTFY